jgi:hypothetical protein
LLFQVLCLLANNAQAHTRYGLASGFGNVRAALFAFSQTFTAWQLTARTFNGILHTGINLFLHCTIFGKSTRHENLLLWPSKYHK